MHYCHDNAAVGSRSLLSLEKMDVVDLLGDLGGDMVKYAVNCPLLFSDLPTSLLSFACCYFF